MSRVLPETRLPAFGTFASRPLVTLHKTTENVYEAQLHGSSPKVGIGIDQATSALPGRFFPSGRMFLIAFSSLVDIFFLVALYFLLGLSLFALSLLRLGRGLVRQRQHFGKKKLVGQSNSTTPLCSEYVEFLKCETSLSRGFPGAP